MWTTGAVDTVGYYTDTSCRVLAGETELDSSPGCLLKARSGSWIYYLATPLNEDNDPTQYELCVMLLPTLA